MRHAAPARLLGSLLLLVAADAFGLGLGRVSTLSYLGNPLELSVGISAEVSDGLTPDCVNAEVYVGDHRLASELVRIRINRAPDGTPISLRLVTGARIDEPVATVTLMLGCPTSVTRRYVVFIDPPSVNLAQAEGTDAATAAPSEAPIVMRPAPPQARAPSARSRRADVMADSAAGFSDGAGTPRNPPQPRRFDEDGSRVAVPVTRTRSRSPTTMAATGAASAVAASTGARLRLESAPPGQQGSPAREQTAGSTRAAPTPGASASGIGELAAQVSANSLALDQARLRALEERFNRLRTDNEATKRSLAELQAGLKAAQGERFDKSVVYALAAVAALLLLALLTALLRLRSRRGSASWSTADAVADPDGPSNIRGPNEPADKPALSAPVRLDERRADPAVEQHAEASWPAPTHAIPSGLAAVRQQSRPLTGRADHTGDDLDPVERHSLDQPQTMPGPVYGTAANAPAASHGASIDELVDLDQQAEFFVVLGQDDAAIDLLTGHVQTTGDASPLPYLKLLDIYRRRGEQTAYTRTRERFNRRFGATAPDWEDESQANRSLEEHVQVVERLQAVWSDPANAMQLLESLLFRRDPSVPEFDLPVYGELLFLYSIARDLVERVVPYDHVDLLLPLDDESPPPASLGFDLSLDPPKEETPRTAPATLDFDVYLPDAPEVPPSIAASTEVPADAPKEPSQHHR